MIGKIAAEDYGLNAEEGQQPQLATKYFDLSIKVLFLAPYLLVEAVAKETETLRLALSREFLGYRVDFVDVEPPFEEPLSGEFYWLAPHARQATETKKRYRKQVLAGIATVLRAVGRLLPDFIAGIQQGAMSAALCSNPLLLEVAARQRVATDAELTQLRAAWPRIRGI